MSENVKRNTNGPAMDTTGKPKVMCVATARPTFAVDSAREHTRQAFALLDELGAEVTGTAEPVMTSDELDEVLRHFDSNVDLVLHICSSFSDANPALALYGELNQPVLVWAFREPGPVGDRLWLNSLCGANLIGHALDGRGGHVRLVYGNPDEPEIRGTLARALVGELPPAPALPQPQRPRAQEMDVREKLQELRGKRIGAAGDPPPGFTPSHYDGELVERVFGVHVTENSLDRIFGSINALDDESVTAEQSEAESAEPSLRNLDPEHRRRSAAATTALREFSTESEFDALALRCWPEFPTEMGVCPCSSMSRLADNGTATTCERDVYGALTMLLLESLGSGPSYLVDTVEWEQADNVVRFWHCGSAATTLAADTATRSVHCNRKIGVAGDFALKPGPVIIARLTEDTRGTGDFRLLISSGESLSAPNRFQGNTATVRLDADAQNFVHVLVTGGFPHHTVLAWEDVRPQLRTAADLLGIPIVEW